MTMYDVRTNLSQQVIEDVRTYFQNTVRVYQSVIPRNVRLGEAPSFGKPIALYDPKSKGAEAYASLAQEVFELMSTQRLGRGLRALIPETEPERPGGEVQQIALELIEPNPYQPREHFDEEKTAGAGPVHR